ncbi:MAG: hypothetical protein IPM77_06245 [Crocinitomicaceae bacterium]|nr:hypothetical protein [Crocinitomicaceae bacterium]
MKKIYFGLVLFSFLACEQEQAPQEVISFEELAGQTGNEPAPASSNNPNPILKIQKLNDFVNSQLYLFDTISNLKSHPVDRFGYSSFSKLNFSLKSMVNSEDKESASLYYYSFSDSIKTQNAFYNWLDCFGENCESVLLEKDMDKIQSGAAFALVYDTTIVAAEYNCNDKVFSKKSFQDSLLSKFGKSYKYRFEVNCSGKLEWK